jgi:hypothetical protein
MKNTEAGKLRACHQGKHRVTCGLLRVANLNGVPGNPTADVDLLHVVFVSVAPKPFVVSYADEEVHSIQSAAPDSNN